MCVCLHTCMATHAHTYIYVVTHIHTYVYVGTDTHICTCVRVFDRVFTRRCHHFYFLWAGVKKGTKKEKIMTCRVAHGRIFFCYFHLAWPKPSHPGEFYERCTGIMLQSLLSLLQLGCAPGPPHTPALVCSHTARKSPGFILICPLKPMSFKIKS